jgi:hypothetical protein
MSTQPFRFLDLPTGLRCMVYEEIEITTNKHELKESQFDDDQRHVDPEQDPSMTLFRRILRVSMLATCHLIHREATPILAQKAQQLVEEPVRLSIDWIHACNLLPVLRARLIGSSSYVVPAHIWTNIGPFINGVVSAISKSNNRVRPSASILSDVEITFSFHNNRIISDENFIEAFWELFYLSIRLNLTMVYNGYPVSSRTLISASDYFRIQIETVINRQQTVTNGSHIKLRDLDDVEWAEVGTRGVLRSSDDAWEDKDNTRWVVRSE